MGQSKSPLSDRYCESCVSPSQLKRQQMKNIYDMKLGDAITGYRHFSIHFFFPLNFFFSNNLVHFPVQLAAAKKAGIPCSFWIGTLSAVPGPTLSGLPNSLSKFMVEHCFSPAETRDPVFPVREALVGSWQRRLGMMYGVSTSSAVCCYSLFEPERQVGTCNA